MRKDNLHSNADDVLFDIWGDWDKVNNGLPRVSQKDEYDPWDDFEVPYVGHLRSPASLIGILDEEGDFSSVRGVLDELIEKYEARVDDRINLLSDSKVESHETVDKHISPPRRNRTAYPEPKSYIKL